MRVLGGFVCCGVIRFLKNFWQEESAQGITEYGAILAFVSLLVALTFGLTSGSLMPAISAAFHSVASQLNALSSEASSSSGS